MAYPRYRASRSHKFAQRTAGDLSPASTSWAAVDTSLDLTLYAQAGDVIQYGISFQTENEASTLRVDVGTLVSSAIVSYFGGATDPGSNYGVSGWTAPGGVAASIAGSVMRTLVSGDIVAGFVTLRLRYRCDTAVAKTVHAVAARPLQVWAQNLGPVDPN